MYWLRPLRLLLRPLRLLLWLALAGLVGAAEVIPPAPARYFNDYAQVTSPATAEQLNRTLEDFEKTTSSQIVVAIFSNMQSDSSIEDYANRVFRAWKVGQRGKNNGAVLFVFVQDRRIRIEVGYGLEGALPDVIAKRIIEEEIKPHFRRGDFDGGLSAGVNAILQATRGEYKGTWRTVPSRRGQQVPVPVIAVLSIIVLFLFILMASLIAAARRGTVYPHRRRSYWWGWGDWSSRSSSGNGWSSGGFSGGFLGGGGSSGGGGASGSW